jgi:hypothetical protein
MAEKTGNLSPMKYFFLALCFPFFLSATSFITQVTFSGEPAVALKTLGTAFNTLGYRLDIESFIVANGSGELRGEGVGNRPFNPSIVGEMLKEQGVGIVSAYFDSKNTFVMSINVENGIWNVPLLGRDEGYEIKKVTSPQWFHLEEAQFIRVEPSYGSKWYPDVAIYDTSMQLLSSFRSLTPKEEFQSELPHGACYLKISNVYGMKVLSGGMWIASTNPEQ